MVCKAALVTNPNFVDLLILARHGTFDHHIPTSTGFLTGVVSQVTANRTVGADRSGGFEFPGTGTKAEISRGEGTNRANIGGVSRPIAVKTGIRIRDNIGRPTTIVKFEHGVTGNFILKTDTAGTLNAALTIEEDQITQRQVLGSLLLLIENEAALTRSVGHRQVL